MHGIGFNVNPDLEVFSLDRILPCGFSDTELVSHQLQLGGNEYQTLRHLCTQWNTIRGNMEAASALPEVLAKYRQVRDHEAPPPTSLEDLLDDILDTLVTEFDAEELPQ